MTRPSLLVRLLGYPPVTFGLLALCAYIAWQWYGGHAPFVMALGAGLAAAKAISAYDKKREFDDNERERQAVEEGLELPPEPVEYENRIRSVARVVVALGTVYVSMVQPPQLPDTDVQLGLQLAGWLALLYLAVKCGRLLWAFYRRRAKSKAVELPAQQEPDFVTWTLAIPSEAPSRDMAESELPDYCAALIKRDSGV